jgi:hypothetical protein
MFHDRTTGGPGFASDAGRSGHAVEYLPKATLGDAAELSFELEVETRHELAATEEVVDDGFTR